MRFRVLGAIEVWNSGTQVRISGVNQSKALAVLLAEVNHTVPLHRLVDAFWDEEPPATAKRQVQNSIAAMRKALAANGSDPIERIGDGYRITTSELDWLDFEHAVAQAHASMASGDPSDAEQLLTQALGLWQGPALSGLTGRLIESAAHRMDEARWSATEDLIGVEIELGRYGPAIDRARDLLVRYPSRQKTAGRLMLALHCAGRNEEALQVYSDLRARLAEDLGLSPDGNLQRLHTQILRDEAPKPTAAVARRAPRPEPPTPAQLPADVAGFVGRKDKIARLDAMLDQGLSAVAALTGVGGSGKTALAVRWGHLRRDRFPDGQLYVNLRGYDIAEPIAPIEALGSILRALGQPGVAIPTEVDEATALYRSLLADRRMLVVIDNARTVSQVRPLLPGGRDTVAIVTSRDRLNGLAAIYGARSITLDALSRHEAVDLLASMVGAERLFSDPEAAHRIAELCAWHPLALRLAGANLANREHDSVAAFAAALAEDSGRLKMLSVDGDPRVAVTATFDQSFATLPREAQLLLCQLGVLPGKDFTTELAVAISTSSEAETKQALSTLANSHLLGNYRPGRYRFHDLMRLYAGQLQEKRLTEAERGGVIHRFIEWHRASGLIDEFDNIVDACRQWSDHPKVWRLTVALRSHLNIGFALTLVRELAQHALAVSEAHDDVQGIAHMQSMLGGFAAITGDFETAVGHGRIAIELIRDHDCDDDGLIRASHGSILYNLGRPLEAEPYMREAVAVAEAQGRTRSVIACGGSLGAIYHKLGRYEKAEQYLRRAAELAGRTSQYFGYYSVLACVFLDKDRLAEAGETLVLAMRMAADFDSPRQRMLVLLRRSELRRAFGDLDRARDDLTEALALARKNGLQSNEHEIRCHLSRVRSEEGDPARALREIRELLAELEGGQNVKVIGESLLIAAGISMDAGLPSVAVEYAEAARRNIEPRHIPLRHGRSLLALARAHAALGDTEAARAHAKQALGIFTEIGVPDADQAADLVESG